ncbi:hypothetical protein OUZ56_022537 [Daphnia magna]|uniref:Uncharacterized protein n=1 Tax=Daphnia magna TaxID=35525 RepID=A0ABR0AWT8_9CRUS|nr:hypothetical protein OUZ56_022537 [Daphnia magna]
MAHILTYLNILLICTGCKCTQFLQHSNTQSLTFYLRHPNNFALCLLNLRHLTSMEPDTDARLELLSSKYFRKSQP